jgi:hypothetical protein
MDIPDFLPDSDLSLTSSENLINEIKNRYGSGVIFLIRPLTDGTKDGKIEDGIQLYGKQEYSRYLWGNAAELCTHLRIQADLIQTMFANDLYDSEYEYEEQEEEEEEEEEDI